MSHNAYDEELRALDLQIEEMKAESARARQLMDEASARLNEAHKDHREASADERSRRNEAILMSEMLARSIARSGELTELDRELAQRTVTNLDVATALSLWVEACAAEIDEASEDHDYWFDEVDNADERVAAMTQDRAELALKKLSAQSDAFTQQFVDRHGDEAAIVVTLQPSRPVTGFLAGLEYEALLAEVGQPCGCCFCNQHSDDDNEIED